MSKPTLTIRLWVLLARQSDIAIVLRRGPSKQVLLIRWHRTDDTFYFGQWLKGRIYELRCDLSPSGERFLYFAASYKPPLYSWTAVSRPPFLTAIALWPKGDCWGGGGQFKTETRIALNHRPEEMKLAKSFRLAASMKIEPFGAYSGHGEDSPLHESTLQRGGWKMSQSGKAIEHSFGSRDSYTFEPAEIWSKPNPVNSDLYLNSSLVAMHRREGAWRVLEHSVRHEATSVLNLGESDWADWDGNGDLLYASRGSIFRRRISSAKRFREPICLVDTSNLRFKEVPPSAAAESWHESLRLLPGHRSGA